MYYPDSASWIITIYFIITHPFIIYFLIRHIFSSGLPTTMTDVMGVPATAGLPKNLSELAVFNGMPLEHANRVVSTYVLRGTWDVYLYNVLLVAEYERFGCCFCFSLFPSSFSSRFLLPILLSHCLPHSHNSSLPKVSIAPRPLKTLQSGNANAHLWEITWDTKEFWSNPLMGWTSSADPLSTLTVSTLLYVLSLTS